MQLSVKLLGGSILIDTTRQDTIWMLKQKIQERYHYPIWRQSLFDIRYEEPVIFNDDSTIQDYGLEDEIGLWVWMETCIPPVRSVLERIVKNIGYNNESELFQILEHCQLERGEPVAFKLKLLGPKQYVYCSEQHKFYQYDPSLYSNSMVMIEARKELVNEKMLHIPSGMMVRGIFHDIEISVGESHRIDIHVVMGKPYSIYDAEGKQVFQDSVEKENWLRIRYDNIV